MTKKNDRKAPNYAHANNSLRLSQIVFAKFAKNAVIHTMKRGSKCTFVIAMVGVIRA